MNDLPALNPSGNNTALTPGQNPDDSQIQAGTVGMAKEVEDGITPSGETLPLQETGKEVELSAELSQAGVTISPTSISLPPPLTKMGVAPAGLNVTVGTGSSVTLPLTDDQIALGLHQSVTSSWRWLAEWCVKKLKQLHLIIRNIKGKPTEVRVN